MKLKLDYIVTPQKRVDADALKGGELFFLPEADPRLGGNIYMACHPSQRASFRYTLSEEVYKVPMFRLGGYGVPGVIDHIDCRIFENNAIPVKPYGVAGDDTLRFIPE